MGCWLCTPPQEASPQRVPPLLGVQQEAPWAVGMRIADWTGTEKWQVQLGYGEQEWGHPRNTPKSSSSLELRNSRAMVLSSRGFSFPLLKIKFCLLNVGLSYISHSKTYAPIKPWDTCIGWVKSEALKLLFHRVEGANSGQCHWIQSLDNDSRKLSIKQGQLEPMGHVRPRHETIPTVPIYNRTPLRLPPFVISLRYKD